MFTKEVHFEGYDLSKEVPEKKVISREFKFKKLSKTDKSQHQLFFLLFPLFQNQQMINGDTRVIADPVILHNLVIKAIECTIVLNERDKFEMHDYASFMNDGLALVDFANWYMNEHIVPFFFQYLKDYMKLA